MKRKLCDADLSHESASKKLKIDFELLFKEKSFLELTFEELHPFLKQKKQVMEDLWDQFEQATERQDYKQAAIALVQTNEMGYYKGIEWFRNKRDESSYPIEKDEYQFEDQLKDPEEGFLMGVRYSVGLGLRKNIDAALFYFLRAAEQGHAGAQCYIGSHCSQKKDFEQALYWSNKAAEQNYAGALLNMNTIYFYGHGVAANVTEAFRYINLASSQGYAPAVLRLASYLKLGKGCAINYEESFLLANKIAAQGDIAAQAFLGGMYLEGLGIAKNVAKAINLLKNSAENGNLPAQLALGNIYHAGNLVAVNLKEAFIWREKAAQQGHALAQSRVGWSYYQGEGIEKNIDKAYFWFTKAAEQGDIQSQHNLGIMHLFPDANVYDSKKAFFWLRKCAVEGFQKTIEFLSLKTEIPMALYTLAWSQKNKEKLADLILTNEEIRQEFLTEDLLNITTLYKDEVALLSFIQLLKTFKNKEVNSFLIDWLIALDLKIRIEGIERNESLAILISVLANEIEWGEAKVYQVYPLMHFFCLQYLEDNTYTVEENSSFIEPLIKLWYRTQSFCNPSNDMAVQKLLASVLVHYSFKGQYELQCSLEISSVDVNRLVYICQNKTLLSLEASQILMQNLKLVETKLSFSSILPQLKTYFMSMDKRKENTLSFFAVLYKAFSALDISNKAQCVQVIKEMKKAANKALASEHEGLFAVVLKPEERKLALLMQKEDSVALSQWIKEIENPQPKLQHEDSNVIL